MLTGDKFQTAENVALACQLIDRTFQVYKLQSKQDVERYCSLQANQDNDNLKSKGVKRAIIVEGSVLGLITAGKPSTKIYFTQLAKSCDAVICCRVSPGEKKELVELIKKDDASMITAAVGDGSNDVSMIKEAHIGIGIYGKEGIRAA